MNAKKIIKLTAHGEFNDIFKRHPLTYIDIGAAGELDPKWKQIQSILKVVGFEPEQSSYLELIKKNNKGRTYINSALYSCRSNLPLYITNKRSCSSLYEPNKPILDQFPSSDRLAVAQIENIDVDTLDSQLQQNRIDGVDFIKIDTQGSELDILKGGSQTLQNTFGIKVEVEFEELYKNQPLFSDVHHFMKQNDFHLFNLTRTYWKRNEGAYLEGMQRGQLVSGDAIYLKSLNKLKTQIDYFQSIEQKKSKVLKAILITIHYGYRDYGTQLFNLYSSFFSNDEQKALSDVLEIKPKKIRRIPNFPGRKQLKKIMDRLSHRLEYEYYWHVSGDEEI